MSEQLYLFIDITQRCFDSVAAFNDTTDYHTRLANLLADQTEFTVGDMLCFRDELLNDGFRWGKDFYVKKVPL